MLKFDSSTARYFKFKKYKFYPIQAYLKKGCMKCEVDNNDGTKI